MTYQFPFFVLGVGYTPASNLSLKAILSVWERARGPMGTWGKELSGDKGFIEDGEVSKGDGWIFPQFTPWFLLFRCLFVGPVVCK